MTLKNLNSDSPLPKSSPSVEAASEWLTSQQKPMENLLEKLVQQSSWTQDKRGVDLASQILRQAMPLPCHPVPSKSYGDQNVFHNRVPSSQGGVLLVGHIDTVFPQDRFAGYQSQGNIARGPGVLDMKGGLVVIAFALQALQKAGWLDSVPLSSIVVSEEEIGSPESTPLLKRLARGARACLVFESGRKGDAIITRRKGTGSFTATAHGRAAHAGNAHAEGANAIWSLARFVDRVQQLTDYPKGTTLNVGKISGGMGKNTVPDLSEALVDLRFINETEAQALKSKILEAAQECALPGTSIAIQWGPGRFPMEKTEASEVLRASYAHFQRQAGLGDGECGLVGGGSDAATTSHEGIPSIDGLGPRGQGFHTLEEYVELDSLIPKTQALVRYLGFMTPHLP